MRSLRSKISNRLNNRQNRFSRAWKKVKQTALAATLAVALPLVSSFSGGCIHSIRNSIYFGDNAEQCSTHNSSTILINRETDGIVAPASELERSPRGPLIDEPLIDFINEVQGRTSTPMSEDLYLTRVEDSCVAGARGYVLSDEPELGVFTPHIISLSNVLIPFHEIGHLPYVDLDDYSIEVPSHLHAYESFLMGFAVFSEQEHTAESLPIWASYVYREGFGGFLPLFSRLLSQRAIRSNSLSENDRASIFLFMELMERRGDVQSLSEDISDMDNDELNEAVERRIDEFVESMSGFTSVGIYRLIDLEIRMLAFEELYRREGYDTAMAFFDAYSNHTSLLPTAFGRFHAPFQLLPRGFNGIAYDNYSTNGLEGLNCTNRFLDVRTGSSTDTEVQTQGTVRYCCIARPVITDGQIEFPRVSLTAEVGSVVKLVEILFDDESSVHVTQTDTIHSITSRTELAPGENCY